jgi:phenylacetate-CoA ligase
MIRNLYQYRNIEFFPPARIREVQEARLREHLRYCAEASPYYRTVLKAAGIDENEITPSRLAELPLTDKSAIEEYNVDFCAVPLSKIVDIVLSSGTTGKPIRMMYTDHDLRRLAYNEERSFAGVGISDHDTVLLTCTIDRCFVAGLAYFLGITSLGAAAIRNGRASLESHLEAVKRMWPTVIVGVPSFLRKLGLFLREAGMDPAKTAVSRLVCIGEPLRRRDLQPLKVGEDLEAIWEAKTYSTYASSEIVTTFCECPAQQGGHLHPDLAIVEIVDDEGKVLPSGETGEVVVTPMAVEGMPLVRFKTGDISFLIDQPCTCGRNSIRLGPILGRKNQMMKVKGTTLYPQAIYTILEEMGEVEEYYITVTGASDLSDAITVHAAVNDPRLTAEMIRDKLQARLRVKPAVILADEKSVRDQVYTPTSRKPIRFFDRRESDAQLSEPNH